MGQRATSEAWPEMSSAADCAGKARHAAELKLAQRRQEAFGILQI